MSSLPLKVKVGIRDHWSKEDSPVQNALRDLQELLGHAVVVEPEWPLLVAELDALYPDKANLVVVIAGCMQAWAKSMMELLDDSAHAAWTEQVLEKAGGRMRVSVEVAASDKATTAWSEQLGGFVVRLPKKKVYQPAELYPAFRGGLLACFDTASKKPQQQLPLPDRRAAAAGTDDWEGVEVDAATGQADVVRVPTAAMQTSARPKIEFLPDAASLPRPDELLLKPPYHITLVHGHNNIELQSSHSPTLQLLAEYLKRWCRTNHGDSRNPPAVKVELHQSAFGLGEMFDRLTLSTEPRSGRLFTVTSPMIAALIEGVLGYELLSAADGSWRFRRDVEFKTL